MKDIPKFLPARVIKKHNSLTDGAIPGTPRQVLPDRLLNALYYKYEKEGPEFELSLQELKELVGLAKEKDDQRIYNTIAILQHPIQIRNFSYKGQEITWLSAPFLAMAIRYKQKNTKILFKIEPMVLEAIKQKGGYTPLDINICNRFKTKYGLKIYEMYQRYRSLPNRISEISSNDIGVIKKTLDELNFLFSTRYTSPSKLLDRQEKAPINRGLREIQRVTGEVIECFYDKYQKLFVFSWGRDISKERYPTPECIIPTVSVAPFAKWYTDHFVDRVKSRSGYLQNVIERIYANTLSNIERYYQLFLLERGKDPQKCFDHRRGKFIC
ncbi:hypothetical protein NitYY0826_P17 (plasmid) [Nitratiruptor sp. YY08-26]|uniref:replication initiation protein n=1 Tax=unclassified Nitratiruptor TaxID=2624044 RepID=UPI0018EDDC29|nr:MULTISPECIES: replication initiation protein [unclassified Nitratiruptor]BCD63176.1 hypothetical protein NitYY0813_P17 [Nitratiruptor sp. YY08-13]BCD67112.1 hypothetical protein NitYY0826_P17 [Nitratiruptor sp. YY08-26]